MNNTQGRRKTYLLKQRKNPKHENTIKQQQPRLKEDRLLRKWTSVQKLCWEDVPITTRVHKHHINERNQTKQTA